jgi:hypothetical protein
MNEKDGDVSLQLKEYRMNNNKSSIKSRYGRDKHGPKRKVTQCLEYGCRVCSLCKPASVLHTLREAHKKHIRVQLHRFQFKGDYSSLEF